MIMLQIEGIEPKIIYGPIHCKTFDICIENYVKINEWCTNFHSLFNKILALTIATKHKSVFNRNVT